MISFFVVRYRIYWKLLAVHVALYTDSGHFVMPPLVSCKRTSEKWMQKFHTDDMSLPRSGWYFLLDGNLLQLINQKHF